MAFAQCVAPNFYSRDEYLVRRGADVHVRGRSPDASAREIAESIHRDSPSDAAARRIHEICSAM